MKSKGTISALEKVLECAIDIRTCNTQIQRISENDEITRRMMVRYGTSNELENLSDLNTDEIKVLLNNMENYLDYMKRMIENAKEEINAIREDYYLE